MQLIHENFVHVMSNDSDAQARATQYFRRLLSIEKNPPIQQVIESGVVPRFVQFLQRHDNPVSFLSFLPPRGGTLFPPDAAASLFRLSARLTPHPIFFVHKLHA